MKFSPGAQQIFMKRTLPKIGLLPILFLLFLFSGTLYAQPGRFGGGYGGPRGNAQGAFITGTVVLSPDEEGGEETPGVGVTVIVIGTRTVGKTARPDTSYAVVGRNGTFVMRDLPTGEATVTFSLMGYHEQSSKVTLRNGENRVIANLKPESYNLDAAVVKTTPKTLSVQNDTVTFHASAVKYNKGEMAIDIIEQMPGVEVTENGVSVMNENINAVYVDGALLFGDQPMTALNNLPAEEVVSIKSFQEYENKDPRHKISKNEEKRRVINIETRSKPKFVTNGNVLVGGGYDTDSTYHKFRYTLGGDVSANSEKLQISARFNLNNINNAATRMRGNSFRSVSGGGSPDLRSNTLSLNFNKKWMSPEARNFALGSVSGSYSFSNSYNVSESISERIYFPNEQYTSRVNRSSSVSSTTNTRHNFSVNGMKSLPDGRVSLNSSFSLTDGSSSSYSSNYNYQDNLPRQGTSTSNNRDTDGHSYDISFNANKGFFDKLRLNASASLSKNSNDGFSTKIDTTTSTITTTVLNIDSGTSSRNSSVRASVRYEVTDRTSLSAGYSFSNDWSSTVQWAYDVTDPATQVVDSVNTYNRTNDNHSHNVNLSFRTAFSKDRVILDLEAAWRSTGINRSDAFPEMEPVYSRKFNAFIPSLSLENKSQINHWSFRWSTSTSMPSVEQLRPRLNNTNLYSVSAGNPNLRQGRSNSFSASFSTVLSREAREAIRAASSESGGGGRQNRMRMFSGDMATFSMNGSFRFNNDVIVNKQTYYASETYLPDYDYWMPAQSTFSSYENASGSYSASLRASVSFPISKILSVISVDASSSWDKTPSYVNSELIHTQNFRPTLSVGYRSNFSRNFRLNVNGNGSYIHQTNTNGSKKDYFTEAIRGGFEINNILKLIYLGGNYTKTFSQGMANVPVNDNILDLNGGIRFGPRNNIDISFMIHDLLNRTRGFSTSMTEDYVSNRWTHNFGRYFMVTLAYSFNKR